MHEICHLKIPPTQNTKSHFHHMIFVRNNWGLKLFVLKLKCTINKYIESSHCWMGDDVGPTLLMFFIWLPWLYWHLFNCNFTTTVTSKSIPCQNSCIPGARLVFHRPSKLQRPKDFELSVPWILLEVARVLQIQDFLLSWIWSFGCCSEVVTIKHKPWSFYFCCRFS